MSKIKAIDNLCTSCYKDTSFGSGLYVNRIPSVTSTEIGYMCADCQMYDCDRCDKPIGCDEDIYLESINMRVHEDCATKEELINQQLLEA